MRPPAMRRFLLVLSSFLLASLLTLTACADDPILGPKGEDDSGGGGSYGNVNRLTPSASDSAAAADSSRSNPQRF